MALEKIARKICGWLTGFIRWAFGAPIAKALDPRDKAKRDAYLTENSLLQEGNAFSQLLNTKFVGASSLDERVIEYPIALGFIRSLGSISQILDVGSVLNNRVVTEHLERLPNRPAITHLNPAPDNETLYTVSENFLSEMVPRRELRSRFDLCMAMSTVEHIGWSNRQYGIADPSVFRRPSEMPLTLWLYFSFFVLRPGGWFFASFPVGHGTKNLHPRTCRWASQTFSQELVSRAETAAVELGFEAVRFESFVASGADFVPAGQNVSPWKVRYGRGVPAAAAVGFLWGQKPVD